MAILLTGGTGKTSLRISILLQRASIPYLLASRHPSKAPPSSPSIKFDWEDSSTYSAPFTSTSEKITATYLIAPHIADATSRMIEFINLARGTYGVKRFVMLTGSNCEKGGEMAVGGVWGFLDGLRGEGVESTVFRATWFMENLSEWQHKSSIREEGKIYTACGDAKIPFVSAQDIAAVAFVALTSETPVPDTRVIGPELLTHDDIATKLSTHLNKPITNIKLTSDESEKRWEEKLGMPKHVAKFMAKLETTTASGKEEETWGEGEGEVERVTGRRPMGFDEWVEENKGVWE